jgi:hypothetical protein
MLYFLYTKCTRFLVPSLSRALDQWALFHSFNLVTLSQLSFTYWCAGDGGDGARGLVRRPGRAGPRGQSPVRDEDRGGGDRVGGDGRCADDPRGHVQVRDGPSRRVQELLVSTTVH